MVLLAVVAPLLATPLPTTTLLPRPCVGGTRMLLLLVPAAPQRRGAPCLGAGGSRMLLLAAVAPLLVAALLATAALPAGPGPVSEGYAVSTRGQATHAVALAGGITGPSPITKICSVAPRDVVLVSRLAGPRHTANRHSSSKCR